jgi:uncharacterized protein (TIGR02996 family)
MTDAALLAAIVAEPDDDTPRLVYADWLDENDRPDEAAFLRVQCARAAADPDHPDYPDLLLRDQDSQTWLTAHHPNPPLRLPKNLQLLAGANWWRTAHRGFPRFLAFNENGRSPTKAARTIGPALERAFESLPTRAVVLRYLSVEQLTAVLRLPVIERVTTLKLELRVGGEEADEAARVVASAPLLRNLRELTLWLPVGEAGCAALGASPHLARLESFSANAGRMADAAVRALAGGDWFAGLRTLELDGDGEFPDGVLDALAASPPFPNLHTLGLPQSTYPVAAWQAFARSAAFPRLAQLDLADGNMSGGRMAALARARGFSLRSIDLMECGIGNDGADALANSPQANSLRSIGSAANGIGPAGAKALCGSPRFGQLRRLTLAHNALGAAPLRALGENPALRGLTALDLGSTHDTDRLTTAHVREFLDAFAPTDLRHLVLSGLPVGVRGAKLLASPKFAGLTRLGLGGCHLGDGGAAAVIASPGLQSLISLDLSANDLTTGVKGLADVGVMPRLAECDLTRNRLSPDLTPRLARPGFRLG